MIVQGQSARVMEKAAWLIYKEGIEKLLRQQELVVMAVPGGRSVAAIFKELKKFPVDWRRVRIFMLDERLVPLDHQESNFRLVHKELAGHVADDTLCPFTFPPGSPEQGCAAYENTLNCFGGRFDIVLASSGEDGHIASLFPGRDAILDDRSGFLIIADSPKPPPERMTAGKRLIKEARVGYLLFMGSSKKDAVDSFLNPDLDAPSCPAKVILDIPKHFIFTDLEIDLP